MFTKIYFVKLIMQTRYAKKFYTPVCGWIFMEVDLNTRTIYVSLHDEQVDAGMEEIYHQTRMLWFNNLKIRIFDFPFSCFNENDESLDSEHSDWLFEKYSNDSLNLEISSSWELKCSQQLVYMKR